MDRRLFISGLVGGVMGLSILNKVSGTSKRLPTMFIGHGSPMNAVEDNSFTQFLKASPTELPLPATILVISAHWETRGTKVLKVEQSRTIHDFGGFPEALYKIQYPAPGNLEIADRVVDLGRLHQVEADHTWGLDHGSWTILKHMYPKADIPVVQLSLNQNMTLKEHMEFASSLKSLRDEGVLILGSGNITHNLRRVVWGKDASPLDWAVEFDEMIKSALLERNNDLLLGKDSKFHSLWSIAHPSLEHYLPLLYAYGASDKDEQAKFIFEGMQMGSLSMRSVTFG
jgi:4,5-DOPA dioxygenase extradiol